MKGFRAGRSILRRNTGVCDLVSTDEVICNNNLMCTIFTMATDCGEKLDDDLGVDGFKPSSPVLQTDKTHGERKSVFFQCAYVLFVLCWPLCCTRPVIVVTIFLFFSAGLLVSCCAIRRIEYTVPVKSLDTFSHSI